MVDLQGTKIEIFTGVNDTPVEPTASKAGNGSHLIERFNNLIDEVESDLSNLESAIANPAPAYSKWELANFSFTVPVGYSVVLMDDFSQNISTLEINLPQQKDPGDWVELVKFAANYELRINVGGRYKGSFSNIVLRKQYEAVKLIWLGDEFGWIPDRENVIEILPSNT